MRETTGQYGEEIMELFNFARFHARPDHETGVETALHKVIPPTRQEPGCVIIHAFRAIRNARLFYIHSRWVDEASCDNHARLPHAVQFVQEVQPLIDQTLEATRANLVE